MLEIEIDARDVVVTRYFRALDYQGAMKLFCTKTRNRVSIASIAQRKPKIL